MKFKEMQATIDPLMAQLGDMLYPDGDKSNPDPLTAEQRVVFKQLSNQVLDTIQQWIREGEDSNDDPVRRAALIAHGDRLRKELEELPA